MSHRFTSRRILVVDDDEGFRHAVATLLTYHGYQVRTANNGEEAVRQQLDNPADIVLCDIVMPRLNGDEAIRAIRAAQPSARIVAVSGAARYCHTRWRETVIGADQTLSKPCSAADLLDALGSGTAGW